MAKGLEDTFPARVGDLVILSVEDPKKCKGKKGDEVSGYVIRYSESEVGLSYENPLNNRRKYAANILGKGNADYFLDNFDTCKVLKERGKSISAQGEEQ